MTNHGFVIVDSQPFSGERKRVKQFHVVLVSLSVNDICVLDILREERLMLVVDVRG